LAVTDRPPTSAQTPSSNAPLASWSRFIKLWGTFCSATEVIWVLARKKMKKGLRQRNAAAFKAQQQARDVADEEARRIPWQLLQEARSRYIDWEEFYFWARSVMESEGSLPSWLATEIEDRCPGFLEDDSRYSAEHANEDFLTSVRLGFWIDDHTFAFARKGGWFNAIAYYAVREPRYQRANVCWSQSVEHWKRARPIRYPSLKEWLADAAKCDDTANLLPEIREQRQCFKLVSAERLDVDVARYIDWEAFAYWCRPALERGSPLPDLVCSELQSRCPGFLELNVKERRGDNLIEQDWHRLMVRIADHFFVDAKREAWFDAILITVHNHPRAIRTMEYWEYCDQRWASGLPSPYPSFEVWREKADAYVDLAAD
jgi:hypothetical protein